VRDWVVRHLVELISGLIFAVIVGLLLDLLNPDSGSRRILRHLNNKRSEFSVEYMRSRISQLEAYREQLASGRGVYLLSFQSVFIILMLFAGVAGMEIASHSGVKFSPYFMGFLSFDEEALLILITIILVALRGLRLAAIETKAKQTKRLTDLDSDIADLKQKVATRSSI
jgi:hypothetical protein